MTKGAIVLDSSIWIEIFGGGRLAKACERERKNATEVHVPALILFEVYRKITVSVSEDRALSAVATMSQYLVIELTREVALLGADLSIEHKLSMADSLVLAHARFASAYLVTLDNDFTGIQGVKIIR